MLECTEISGNYFRKLKAEVNYSVVWTCLFHWPPPPCSGHDERRGPAVRRRGGGAKRPRRRECPQGEVVTRLEHGATTACEQHSPRTRAPRGASRGRDTYVKIKSLGGVNMWKLNQTLRGSFSAVSKPNFASKYSLESSWRDLQDLHAFAPLRPQYFSKFASNFLAFSKLDMLKSSIFFKFRRDFRWFSWNLVGFSQIFLRNAAITRNISISI